MSDMWRLTYGVIGINRHEGSVCFSRLSGVKQTDSESAIQTNHAPCANMLVIMAGVVMTWHKITNVYKKIVDVLVFHNSNLDRKFARRRYYNIFSSTFSSRFPSSALLLFSKADTLCRRILNFQSLVWIKSGQIYLRSHYNCPSVKWQKPYNSM